MRAQRTIDMPMVIRAAAIMLVLVNHARFRVSPDFMGWTDQINVENLMLFVPGGMNLLLMLSGISFFRFLVVEDRQATTQNILRFMVLLAIPAVVLDLLSFAMHGSFSLPELLMVSNWLGKEKIAIYPVWYIQVLLQLNLALLIALQVNPLRRLFINRPLIVSSVLLAVGLIIFAAYALFGSGDLNIRLPHMLLWNFALGWWIYNVIDAPGRANVGLLPRLGGFIVAAGAMFLVYGIIQPGRLPQVTLLLFIYIFVDEIRLPGGAASIITVIGQSVFGIFLLQFIGFAIGQRLMELIVGPNVYLLPFVRVAFGVATGVLGWSFIIALWRTMRRRFDLALARKRLQTASAR